MSEAALLTAFGLGLAGAGHCLGMCGGIAVALNLGGAARLTLTLAYHGGRIMSYTALGALLGLAAGSVEISSWTIALRYLAALLLIGMGLYVTGWWRGMLLLERAGATLWRPVQRFSSHLLPLRNPIQAAALGLCWGMMPCGLIYSSLAWAATAGSATTAALLMLCFGLGTLPVMIAASLGAQGLQSLLRRRELRTALGLLIILCGLWTGYMAILHAGHDPGSSHHHVTQASSPCLKPRSLLPSIAQAAASPLTAF